MRVLAVEVVTLPFPLLEACVKLSGCVSEHFDGMTVWHPYQFVLE